MSNTNNGRSIALGRYLGCIFCLCAISVLDGMLRSGRHELSVAASTSNGGTFVSNKPTTDDTFTPLKPYRRHNHTHTLSSQKLSLNQSDIRLLDSLGVQPRPFPLWDKPLPCFPPEQNWLAKRVGKSPAQEGFLFVKSPKTGSSTGAGINLRIAANIGRRHDLETCKNRFHHNKAAKYSQRDPQKSFLWSMVRDPTSRSISEFFHFQVSRRGVRPSDRNVLRFLKEEEALKDKQVNYLRLSNTTDFQPSQSRSTGIRTGKGRISEVEAINTILRRYDFLGVTERMDETAVALQMILGLKTSDVMFLKR